MYATAAVNVRSGPSTSYSVVGELKKNDIVTKLGTSGSWTKISFYGTTAYVSSAYLATSSTGSSPSTSTGERLYVLRETAVRVGPSSAYRAVAYMDAGDYLEYAGVTEGNWHKVKFGSYSSAYVYINDVVWKDTSSGSSSSTGRVQATTTTAVYARDNSSSAILGYLYKGDYADRINSYLSGYTSIVYQGSTGYVLTRNVSVTMGSDNSSMSSVNAYRYAKFDNVVCYSRTTAASSYRLGFLAQGERVWVDAANSSWAQCYIDGQIMYVLLDDLSKTYVSPSSSGSSSSGSPATIKPGYSYYSWSAQTYDSYWNSTAYTRSGESAAYGIIGRNTLVYVLTGAINGRVQVRWTEDRASLAGITGAAYGTVHTAYVNESDLRNYKL